ncbi:hypothetical protein HYE68_001380 [Fusarium pseudograminearum]|nr:hypothetical protein HYE68_001380 [Fusarium pseudograminearum]
MTDLSVFNKVGDVKPNGQDGFTEDGGRDTSCAQLTAKSTGPTRKRQDAGDVAALGQSLSDLNTRTKYTVQFWYRIATPPTRNNDCTLEAYIGNLRFFNTAIFANDASDSYIQVLTSTSVPASQGELNFKTTCANGDSASVLIDSIFMSNQVTPENIDNYRLDFGDGQIREPTNSPATTAGTQLPPTTQPAAATTTSAAGNGGNGNTSAQPTSAAQSNATTQGNSESTETGGIKPTTASQDGEETSQPTQGSGSQSTSVADGGSSATTSAAGNDGSGSQPTSTTQGSGSDVTTASSDSAETQTASFQGTHSGTPDETTSTSSSEPTQAFVARAEPARTKCLSTSNSVANGDFDNAAADWTFSGSATAVDDKGHGTKAYTIGSYGIGFIGPATGSFSQTISDLEVGENYYLSYAYYVDSDASLPDNECTVKVTFDSAEVETFDPFSESEARDGFRNRVFQVAPDAASSELSFELSCNNNPDAFNLMMDDVYLVRCDE